MPNKKDTILVNGIPTAKQSATFFARTDGNVFQRVIDHTQKCSKNYTGSGQSMEAEGVKRLYELRYLK